MTNFVPNDDVTTTTNSPYDDLTTKCQQMPPLSTSR